jgi:Xaa-Pro dipeptidase
MISWQEVHMARVFTRDEIALRVARVQAAAKRKGVSALVLTRPQNIYYLSGFRASHFAGQLSEMHALVVPTEGLPRLMTRALEKSIAELQWSEKPSFYMDHEDPYTLLQSIFHENSIRADQLGIEERFLSVRQLSRLKRVFPQVQYHDVTGLVEAIAVKSSPSEVVRLRGAAKVTNVGFEAGIAAVREGVYPYEVVGRIHEAMYKSGQSDFDMSMVCVWAGEKGGRMHDTRTTELIKAGDAVTVEIFGVDHQYKVGAQGTVFVGRKPSSDVQKSYGLLVDMFKAARDAVRPGATSGDIYDAANGPYRAAFGSDYYRKVGGTMGLTVFNIALTKGSKDILEPGMCLLVQTLVDDPALITCSSTVLVTDNGYETLTAPIVDLRTV